MMAHDVGTVQYLLLCAFVWMDSIADCLCVDNSCSCCCHVVLSDGNYIQ